MSPSTSVTQRYRLLATSSGVDRYHAALSDSDRVVQLLSPSRYTVQDTYTFLLPLWIR